jgi:plasmid stabilization system protein ParE
VICPTCNGDLETCGHLQQPWSMNRIADSHRQLQDAGCLPLRDKPELGPVSKEAINDSRNTLEHRLLNDARFRSRVDTLRQFAQSGVSDLLVVAQFLETFERIFWNARGESDRRAVADLLRTLMGAHASAPYIAHMERAITALDK